MTPSISPLFSLFQRSNLLILLEHRQAMVVGGWLRVWLWKYCTWRVGAASIRPGDGRIIAEGSRWNWRSPWWSRGVQSWCWHGGRVCGRRNVELIAAGGEIAEDLLGRRCRHGRVAFFVMCVWYLVRDESKRRNERCNQTQISPI